MNKPFFTIIIPVYNVERYLNECVESVINQTFKDIEVILVDDGSSDSSGNICDSYKSADSRIKVIHKKNGGLSSARNAGIKVACGKYIIFLDSDDYWSCNTMLMELSEYAKNREYLIIWSYVRANEDEAVTRVINNVGIKRYSLHDDYKELFAKNILFASACYEAIPGEWFQTSNLMFEENVIAEDIEWFSRLLNNVQDIVSFDADYYVYRNRKGSISNTTTPKTITDVASHINELISQQESLYLEWRDCYIGEQIANFVIVLSNSNIDSEGLNKYVHYFPLMKNTVRKRSKMIYFAYKLFGLKFTINLLRGLSKI